MSVFRNKNIFFLSYPPLLSQCLSTGYAHSYVFTSHIHLIICPFVYTADIFESLCAFTGDMLGSGDTKMTIESLVLKVLTLS